MDSEGSIREANRFRNEQDYLSRRVELVSYPTMLYVELTQNCNLACKMCRASDGYDPSRDMDGHLFDRILNELFAYATMVDLRGWGESTILPNFKSRLKATLETGVRARLISNGLAFDEELWNLFFERDGVVGISLDAPDAELFRQLGRGDLDRVVKNLRCGVGVSRRLGSGLLYLKVVVNSFTIGTLPDVIRLAADIGIAKVTVNPIKCPEHQLAHLTHSRDSIPAILDRAIEVAKTLGVKVQLGSALDQSLAVEYGLPTICSNPWSHALIDYAGRVGFCDHLINHPEYTFGSLVTEPFRNIWNGPAFRDLRAQHIAAEVRRGVDDRFVKCNWCYKNRYLESEHSPFEGIHIREVSTETGMPLYDLGHAPEPATWAGGRCSS